MFINNEIVYYGYKQQNDKPHTPNGEIGRASCRERV